MHKKLLATLVLICLCITASAGLAHGADMYTYFDEAYTNFPEDAIVSQNVVYMNGVYYMSKQAGGLYYSFDAKSWYFIDGSWHARLVGDGKASSDKLVVFYEGILAVSYDGANFEKVASFDPATVIHYDQGLYIAYVPGEQGAHIFISDNLYNWQQLTESSVIDGRFILHRYKSFYIISQLNTADGMKSVIYYPGQPVLRLNFDMLTYSYEKQQFLAQRQVEAGLEVYLLADPASASLPISTPAQGAKIIAAGSFREMIYLLCEQEGSELIYRSVDGLTWEPWHEFFTLLSSTYRDSGQIDEKYYKQSVAIDAAIELIRRSSDGGSTFTGSEVICGNEYHIASYGDAWGVVTADASSRPTNLISTDATSFQQADDAVSFSILNSYAKRGDYLFADRTQGSVIYHPKADPHANLYVSGIEVILNGSYIAFDQPPVIVNDRTMVPLRAIAEALGASISWDGATSTITITKGGNVITMAVGANTAHITYFDGAVYDAALDAPAALINARTLVPVRFIAETLNVQTEWDAGARTVLLTTK